MNSIFRFFSKKYRFKKDEVTFVDTAKMAKETQDNIDKMLADDILKKKKGEKRYAVHKIDHLTYEIVAEKDSFYKVVDEGGNNEHWEEKEHFFSDHNLCYSSTEAIQAEEKLLLSKIDSARYDVYRFATVWNPLEYGTLGATDAVVQENKQELEEFIRKHTVHADNAIFSNYILIGF